MKKSIKFLIIMLVVIVLIVCGRIIYKRAGYHTMKLIVVNADRKRLETMDFNENLMSVLIKKQATGEFKQGQEILVYYDGIISSMYPGIINADKIEILKEKSDKEIPVNVLRYWNFSQNNISAKIEEITSTGIKFSINDKNEYPLDYGDEFSYTILKKNVENETYNESVEFDNSAYTPPVTTDTYSRTSSYKPDPNRFKKVWEEPELIGNGENKNCRWETISEEGKILFGKCDWSKLYGELGQGEYQFNAYRKPEEEDSFFQCVIVKFVIDENGNITYEEPEFGF